MTLAPEDDAQGKAHKTFLACVRTTKPFNLSSGATTGGRKRRGGDGGGLLGGGGGRFPQGGGRFSQGGGRSKSSTGCLVVPHGSEANYLVLVLQVIHIVVITPENLSTFGAGNKMSQVVLKFVSPRTQDSRTEAAIK